MQAYPNAKIHRTVQGEKKEENPMETYHWKRSVFLLLCTYFEIHR